MYGSQQEMLDGERKLEARSSKSPSLKTPGTVEPRRPPSGASATSSGSKAASRPRRLSSSSEEEDAGWDGEEDSDVEGLDASDQRMSVTQKRKRGLAFQADQMSREKMAAHQSFESSLQIIDTHLGKIREHVNNCLDRAPEIGTHKKRQIALFCK